MAVGARSLPAAGALLLAVASVLLAGALVAGDSAEDSAGGSAQGLKTRHVIIMVIDGPRWTETWGRPGRDLIPVRATVLAPQGVWFSDMANDGPTYTNAGHTALVTGFHQDINNSGLELPRNPTLSQRLLAAGAGVNDAWIISSKDKLEILADSMAAGWNHQHVCARDCGKDGNGSGYRDDQTTIERVKQAITRHHPRFILINVRGPDSSGHGKDWDGYLANIAKTDAQAGAVWEHVQADPTMRDRTAMFITNDHGRHLDGHKDGYISHGDNCAGCRKIELLAMGPDFRRGASVDTHRSQIDVAVTAAALLGLAHPGSSGQVIQELFATPISVPAPAPVPVAPAVVPAPAVIPAPAVVPATPVPQDVR